MDRQNVLLALRRPGVLLVSEAEAGFMDADLQGRQLPLPGREETERTPS